MEMKRGILTLSATFAVGVWIFDAAIDFLFFFEGSFYSLLVGDVPVHELYVRTLLSGSFLLFGVIAYLLVTRIETEQRQYETLVTNLPGIVYRCRNEEGWPMEMVRGRSEELIGHSAAEIESGAVSWGEDVIHPDDREGVWERVQEALEGRGSFDITYRVQTETGAQRWVRERGRAVPPFDEQPGVLEGFIADVTKRKALEAHLRETKDRYEALFESIRDAIVVVDTDQRIINANPAFTDLFGYEFHEIEGDSVVTLYEDVDEFEAIETAFEEHIDDPQFTFRVQYEKKSGQTFPGETSVFYLRDSGGEVVGLIGVIRDVSDREDHVQQLQILDRVLRHNLHNSMNVVQGHAELIRESDPDKETQFSARKIIDTSKQLIEMINKEREVTRVLSDRPTLKTVDICQVVEGTVSQIRAEHPDADIALDISEQCEAIGTDMIDRAVGELVRNALSHHDRAEPSITVSIDVGDDTVSVTVGDDGPGIPAMEQTVLTDKPEVEPLYHGSGLGLWFVNLIVRESDGDLTYAENDPRGSEVTICLRRP